MCHHHILHKFWVTETEAGIQDITYSFNKTSVSARYRVPYAVEENLRGMNEWMKERQSLGLFIIRFAIEILRDLSEML